MKALVDFMSRLVAGLRFRLLVLVVFTCAPLIVLILHTSGQDRRNAMASWQKKEQKLQQIARREEQQILDGARQLLLALSESASVRSLSPRRCKKAVDELFTSYPRYA